VVVFVDMWKEIVCGIGHVTLKFRQKMWHYCNFIDFYVTLLFMS
jgi:hypothetical protein